MGDATASEVWRYPAKSMLGEQLDRVVVGRRGLAGDRCWAVRDEQRGGIRGAKKIAGLMRLGASYRDEPVIGRPAFPIDITLPDGSTVGSDGRDVDARLSEALDHPVTLWPLLPPDAREHYRRGAPDTDDLEAELRAIFGREPDEPLPDLRPLPPELFEYESLPGTYFDAFAVHLVTRQSLDRLQELTPGSRVDVRRFRPNVVVDVPDATGEWPEQSWIGRRIQLGSATLEVQTGCPRCVMVTHGFADLPQDRAVLRTVVRDADQLVGVYATVVEPGTLTTGAPVTLD